MYMLYIIKNALSYKHSEYVKIIWKSSGKNWKNDRWNSVDLYVCIQIKSAEMGFDSQ